jgi:hypothetical protein
MAATEAEAADWLERQLTQLVDKLDGLVRLRAGQHNALLGDQHSDNWQGAKRNTFETDYGRQQAALTDLKSAALSLRGAVARALAETLKAHN